MTAHRAEHQFVDLSNRRRVFVVGDLHGRLDLLALHLAQAAFDSARDSLVSLGDLVDRGPYSMEILGFLNELGGAFHLARGNHEETLGKALSGDHLYGEKLHRNGGAWAYEAIEDGRRDEVKALSDRINAAPVALSIKTPGGRMVGMVHADVHGEDWTAMIRVLEDPAHDKHDEAVRAAAHSRKRFQDAKAYRRRPKAAEAKRFQVAGVDHVFFGHCITKEPLSLGNLSWIDTGAFRSGVLTMVEIDTHVTGLSPVRKAA